MPRNSKFRLPRGHRFRPKFDFFTVMALYHGGELLGSIWGPMGSHWVKKMGQNCKKLPCPKIRFRPKLDFTVMAPNHRGDPLMSIMGPMGSHWVQKRVKTIKNYHAPKFEFSTTLRSSISAKIRFYGYGAKSWWGPPRVHLGANGVPLGKIMGQNRKKLPCPKIRIFDYPVLIDFGLNSTWRLWRQITVGNP